MHAVSLATLEPGPPPGGDGPRPPLAADPRCLSAEGTALARRGATAGAAPGRPVHRAGRRRRLGPGGGRRGAGDITVIPMGSDHMPPPDLAGRPVPPGQARCPRPVPALRRHPRTAEEPAPPHRGVREDPGPAAGALAARHGRTLRLGGAGDHREGRRPRRLRVGHRVGGPLRVSPPRRLRAPHRGIRPPSGRGDVRRHPGGGQSPSRARRGAAFEVDPHDVASIAAGILHVATDEPTRRDLVAKGSARADALSWKSIARRHLDVWDQVCRRDPGAR